MSEETDKENKENKENKEVKEVKKIKRYDDNSVYIGKRPTMNYVMAAMVILNRGTDCIIKARGRAISHAVDVAEILKNKFFPTAKYKDIKITTEVLTNDEGRSSNVSSMEIQIAPK